MTFEKSQTAVDRLTPEQRRFTQASDNERSFMSEHNDNKQPGIYVDIVSGAPLFTSDTFGLGIGWPITETEGYGEHLDQVEEG